MRLFPSKRFVRGGLAKRDLAAGPPTGDVVYSPSVAVICGSGLWRWFSSDFTTATALPTSLVLVGEVEYGAATSSAVCLFVPLEIRTPFSLRPRASPRNSFNKLTVQGQRAGQWFLTGQVPVPSSTEKLTKPTMCVSGTFRSKIVSQYRNPNRRE